MSILVLREDTFSPIRFRTCRVLRVESMADQASEIPSYQGAVLRVFGPMTGLPANLVLGLAAGGWSGTYVLFAMIYGPFLLRPNLDE
jgi:uncharacterized protein involved in response to NO